MNTTTRNCLAFLACLVLVTAAAGYFLVAPAAAAGYHLDAIGILLLIAVAGGFSALAFVNYVTKTPPELLPLPILAPLIPQPPNKVRDYCRKYDITNDLNQTLGLAKYLPPGSTTNTSLQGDGESQEIWLVVHLDINATWDEAHNIYNDFIDHWLDTTTPKAHQHTTITYSAKT